MNSLRSDLLLAARGMLQVLGCIVSGEFEEEVFSGGDRLHGYFIVEIFVVVFSTS